MKKNGFTLAELLGVVIILGVIALIIFPTITKSIKNSKDKSYDQQIESILKSAKNWGLENRNSLSNTKRNYVSLDELQQSGYLPSNQIINPETNEEMNGCVIIAYDKEYYQYTYEYEETSCDELTPKIYTFQEIMENSDDVMNNDPDGNLRYVGQEPDNYVWFNNELWRIIGLFDGQVKIIRNDHYSTSLEWNDGSVTRGGDDAGTNNWNIASLNIELNETYLTNIQTNNSVSYNYIDLSHIWNIGGAPELPTEDWTLVNMYNYERGDVPAKASGSTTTWQGAIGLMYPSDYGYSTSSTDEVCSQVSMYDLGDYSDCYNNSWLYDSNNYQWTLTPDSSYAYFAFFITSSGNVRNWIVTLSSSTADTFAVRPTLFLKPEVVIIDGTGTSTDPFILYQ